MINVRQIEKDLKDYVEQLFHKITVLEKIVENDTDVFMQKQICSPDIYFTINLEEQINTIAFVGVLNNKVSFYKISDQEHIDYKERTYYINQATNLFELIKFLENIIKHLKNKI